MTPELSGRLEWKPRLRPALLGALVGVSAAVLVGGWCGLAGGTVLGVVVYGWLAGRPSSALRAEVRSMRVDLPFAADLLAAALRAGATPDLAVACVAECLDGPLAGRLATVARALRLGTPAAEAWSYLGQTPEACRIAQAAVRSQHSGAALAGSLVRVADDLRSDLLVGVEAAARRAGVMVVLPLGLCFLPAFVLAGLVPVIVAMVGDVLSG